MFISRYFGRTLLAAAKSETSAAAAAATSTARTGYNPLEEFFEPDRSAEDDKPMVYGRKFSFSSIFCLYICLCTHCFYMCIVMLIFLHLLLAVAFIAHVLVICYTFWQNLVKHRVNFVASTESLMQQNYCRDIVEELDYLSALVHILSAVEAWNVHTVRNFRITNSRCFGFHLLRKSLVKGTENTIAIAGRQKSHL